MNLTRAFFFCRFLSPAFLSTLLCAVSLPFYGDFLPCVPYDLRSAWAGEQTTHTVMHGSVSALIGYVIHGYAQNHSCACSPTNAKQHTLPHLTLLLRTGLNVGCARSITIGHLLAHYLYRPALQATLLPRINAYTQRHTWFVRNNRFVSFAVEHSTNVSVCSYRRDIACAIRFIITGDFGASFRCQCRSTGGIYANIARCPRIRCAPIAAVADNIAPRELFRRCCVPRPPSMDAGILEQTLTNMFSRAMRFACVFRWVLATGYLVAFEHIFRRIRTYLKI